MTGLAEPRANPLLLGHRAAEAELAAAMRSPRMHHAWLILGPAGIGKATLAFRAARRLLAGPPEGDDLALPPEHPVFRRVASGGHADLCTIQPGWNEKKKQQHTDILIEEARKLPDFLHRTAAEGGWRVAVVDGADTLNRNAANALLKVVEEPPSRTVLFLTCLAAGLLPTTLRSRCRRLTLAPLPDADVAALLARENPERPEAERLALARRASGSIGRALALADADGADVTGLVRRTLAEPLRLGTADALAVADVIARDEAAFAAFMDDLREGLAEAVRAAARAREDAAQRRLLGARSLAEWVAVWQALGTLKDETEGLHLDKREALVQGFKLLARGDP